MKSLTALGHEGRFESGSGISALLQSQTFCCLAANDAEDQEETDALQQKKRENPRLSPVGDVHPVA